jgi:nitrogen regulatory protein PII
MVNTSTAQTRLVLMFTIISQGSGEKISRYFSDAGTAFNLLTFGKGTASSDILEYLGLGDTRKEILISMVPLNQSRDLLIKLSHDDSLRKPGSGIAFTVPLNSVGGTAALKYLRGLPEIESGEVMEQVYSHDLIIAIVDRGFSDDIMHAARSAKAPGGTVIHARGTGAKEAATFFGVTIQPEKDLVLILTERQKRQDIMKAIITQAGPQTNAKAFVFSLPVNGVAGINTDSQNK